jgi:hypothetical protein
VLILLLIFTLILFVSSLLGGLAGSLLADLGQGDRALAGYSSWLTLSRAGFRGGIDHYDLVFNLGVCHLLILLLIFVVRGRELLGRLLLGCRFLGGFFGIFN